MSQGGCVIATRFSADPPPPNFPEVAQLYVEMPQGLGEPVRALKAFSKVQLAAGESTRVTFNLGARDLSVWDEDAHGWTQEGITGEVVTMRVGASSGDLRATCAVVA